MAQNRAKNGKFMGSRHHGGLVMEVRVSGEALGHLSSSSLLNLNPQLMHK